MTTQADATGPDQSSTFDLSRLGLVFLVLLVGMTAYFLWWAAGYTEGHFPIVLVLATIFGVFMAFNIGGNDVANSFGPFAAILDVLRTGDVGQSAPVPTIAMITFGVALIAGLWFIGKNVIQTVGHNLTTIHPASGFSAELSASAVVLFASILGLPVSSTHILIGAVLGIGLVNNYTNWDLMKPIAFAWVVTLPVAAILAAIGFVTLRAIL